MINGRLLITFREEEVYIKYHEKQTGLEWDFIRPELRKEVLTYAEKEAIAEEVRKAANA